MEVILLEKVGKIGGLGSTVNVKSGYARNYLLPQGKAVLANVTNKAEFETRRAELEKAANEKLAAAQARADKINELELTVTTSAGDEGKLFGSIGVRDIADAITAAGVNVAKSEVKLPVGSLRTVGNFEITIQLHSEVKAIIKLVVVAE